MPEARAPFDKPASAAPDPFKSAKWDELTRGRDFSDSGAPARTALRRGRGEPERAQRLPQRVFKKPEATKVVFSAAHTVP